MRTRNTQSLDFNGLEQGKYRDLILQFIVNQVEKGTGKSVYELKKYYSEDALFFIALRNVTTTKKALCTALNIPIEAGCRYKRTFEKNGTLVQSIDTFVCPFTKRLAHLISTNPKEFESLVKTNSKQLSFFE